MGVVVAERRRSVPSTNSVSHSRKVTDVGIEERKRQRKREKEKESGNIWMVGRHVRVCGRVQERGGEANSNGREGSEQTTGKKSAARSALAGPTGDSPYFIVAFADANRRRTAPCPIYEDADLTREKRTTQNTRPTSRVRYEFAWVRGAGSGIISHQQRWHQLPHHTARRARPGPSHPSHRGQTISQKSSPFPWKEKNYGDDSATTTVEPTVSRHYHHHHRHTTIVIASATVTVPPPPPTPRSTTTVVLRILTVSYLHTR
ncbi:hypothetical protein ANTPLA_LOCUS3347 [Anthophora plagiata]